MASTDLPQLVRRARRGYEVARLRSAALGATPILAIVSIAACLAEHTSVMLLLGAGTSLLGGTLLW